MNTPSITEKPHTFAGWVLVWDASGRAFIGKVDRQLTAVGRIHLEPVYEYNHQYGPDKGGKIGMVRHIMPLDLSTSLNKLVVVPARLTELDTLDPHETTVLKRDVDAAEEGREAMRNLRKRQAAEITGAPQLIIPPGAH